MDNEVVRFGVSVRRNSNIWDTCKGIIIYEMRQIKEMSKGKILDFKPFCFWKIGFCNGNGDDKLYYGIGVTAMKERGNEAVIKITDLSFAYPSRDYIFKKLNFDFFKGERIGLVGLNGFMAAGTTESCPFNTALLIVSLWTSIPTNSIFSIVASVDSWIMVSSVTGNSRYIKYGGSQHIV